MDFDITVAAPLDGATKCGLDSQTLIDASAPSDASFDVLRSDEWTIAYDSNSDIAGEIWRI